MSPWAYRMMTLPSVYTSIALRRLSLSEPVPMAKIRLVGGVMELYLPTTVARSHLFCSPLPKVAVDVIVDHGEPPAMPTELSKPQTMLPLTPPSIRLE